MASVCLCCMQLVNMGCMASVETPECPEVDTGKVTELITKTRAEKEDEIRVMQKKGQAGEVIEGTTIKIPAEDDGDKAVTAAAVQWMCLDEGREQIKGEVWGAMEGELEPKVDEAIEPVPGPLKKLTKDKMMGTLEDKVGDLVDKALDKMLEEYASKKDAGSEDADGEKKDDGPLTPEQVEDVTTSWEKVVSLGLETVGVLLFKNIFKIAPEALALFSFKDEDPLYESPKLKKHATGVVKTVGTAVAGLKDLGRLVPVLKALGKTHAGYGVKPEHFAIVGQALVQTLSDGLQDEFTEPVKQAWLDVYTVVSDTMISGFPQE